MAKNAKKSEGIAVPKSSKMLKRCGDDEMTALLRLDNVTTYYGEIRILEGISIEVGEGEVVCLLGGNASGKSTTLKTALGLVRPRSGSVELEGEDVTDRPTAYRIKRGMAIVPENRRVFAPMTVGENLEMGAYANRGKDARSSGRSSGMRNRSRRPAGPAMTPKPRRTRRSP